jgi:phosphatidylserine/phosphatidylglycerophosphate/cardiolipin synthase-like enzyme
MRPTALACGRFVSAASSGFRVYAVTGSNVVAFGITPPTSEDATKDLLGFTVHRKNLANQHAKDIVMGGTKVFENAKRERTAGAEPATDAHPIQSLLWDDLTATANTKYRYTFYPRVGNPEDLTSQPPSTRDRHAFSIDVTTESAFDANAKHQVFFNRGAASSQAFTRKFPDVKTLVPAVDGTFSAEQTKALQWLARDLLNAFIAFVDQAQKGDTLRCAFYEFHYETMVDALAKAAKRGVDVQIIMDAKKQFPRDANRQAVSAAGLKAYVTERTVDPESISHNKFMVYVSKDGSKMEVWTGSTNISRGAVHGHTNVGHWVRDAATAKSFLAYWHLLQSNENDVAKIGSLLNSKSVQKSIPAAPTSVEAVKKGITTIFSPRADGKEPGSALKVLDMYFELVATAKTVAQITLAFGVTPQLKTKLLKHKVGSSPLVQMLLEQDDKPWPLPSSPFVPVSTSMNVYKAFGSAITRSPVEEFAVETTTAELKANVHVQYIHTKFLIRDALSKDPIVVTGSANFSTASTIKNDENMLIIRGDTRVADIYFTEFNRLFSHFYFRSMLQDDTTAEETEASRRSLYLVPNDSWLKKYSPESQTLHAQRLKQFIQMEGAVIVKAKV